MCARRPGDENLKPNQKLNVMLQRILRADYTFPKGKVLRWVVHAVCPVVCLFVQHMQRELMFTTLQ